MYGILFLEYIDGFLLNEGVVLNRMYVVKEFDCSG